jgi:hypothetical protein
MAFRTDKILWYNNGVWGELGYACPNLGDNTSTLNVGVKKLVDVMGRNLSAIMQSEDVDLRTPPTINTIFRVKRLCERAKAIVGARAVPPNVPEMEATHATPAAEVFLLYPVPYFNVRNAFLKEWCAYILSAIGEACQHTSNRKPYEISADFASVVLQLVRRVYTQLGVELLGVSAEAARADDFVISDDLLKTYDPSKFFTRTEMIDTLPALNEIPTEDDLTMLTDGIAAPLCKPFLQTWPSQEKPLELKGNTVGSPSTSWPAPLVP